MHFWEVLCLTFVCLCVHHGFAFFLLPAERDGFFFFWSFFLSLSHIFWTALVDFYKATHGIRWRRSQSWLTGDPCENSWYGVTCLNETETVAHIQRM